MTYQASVPLYWRLRKSKYNLIGTKCKKCGVVNFPPRPLCPKCRHRGQIVDFKFSGKGKILSWTIIRIAPEGFERQVPYATAIIHLDEGTKIAGQVVGDISKIKINSPVRTVFRRMYTDGSAGIIHYGLKWEMLK